MRFEAVERGVNVGVGFVERARNFVAEMLFYDACDYRVESGEEVFELEAVAFERAARAALDDCETSAMENGRDGAREHAIALGGLREVGNLGSAAEISDC